MDFLGKNVCVINERNQGGETERRRNDQSCFHSLVMVPLISLTSDWLCFSSYALCSCLGAVLLKKKPRDAVLFFYSV